MTCFITLDLTRSYPHSPHLSAKEPYTSAKEPCISAKEPTYPRTIAHYSVLRRSRCIPEWGSPLSSSISKRALYICKRALYILALALSLCIFSLSLSLFLFAQDLTLFCASPQRIWRAPSHTPFISTMARCCAEKIRSVDGRYRLD